MQSESPERHRIYDDSRQLVRAAAKREDRHFRKRFRRSGQTEQLRLRDGKKRFIHLYTGAAEPSHRCRRAGAPDQARVCGHTHDCSPQEEFSLRFAREDRSRRHGSYGEEQTGRLYAVVLALHHVGNQAHPG